MWLVSQLHNVLSKSEASKQSECSASGSIKNMSQECGITNSAREQTVVLNNLPSETTTLVNQHITYITPETSENFWTSSECMELQVILPVETDKELKTDSVTKETMCTNIAQELAYESRESTIPRIHSNVLSDNFMLMKQNSSKLNIEKPTATDLYLTSKLSFTRLNVKLGVVEEVIRSKISQSKMPRSKPFLLSSTACNECECSLSSDSLRKKCSQCESSASSSDQTRDKEEMISTKQFTKSDTEPSGKTNEVERVAENKETIYIFKNLNADTFLGFRDETDESTRSDGLIESKENIRNSLLFRKPKCRPPYCRRKKTDRLVCLKPITNFKDASTCTDCFPIESSIKEYQHLQKKGSNISNRSLFKKCSRTYLIQDFSSKNGDDEEQLEVPHRNEERVVECHNQESENNRNESLNFTQKTSEKKCAEADNYARTESRPGYLSEDSVDDDTGTEVEFCACHSKKTIPSYFKLGGSSSRIKIDSSAQDFYELRDQHLNTGTLFEDPEFPADDSSLTFSRRPDRRYEWLRPGEIVDDPQLFVEGYSRFDVQQGELGDCWLLAAVANLTLYRRLFFQIVPDDQSFDENYAGIFHFRFWQYGRWIDVVIDDRLPTYRGQLVYLHSNEENEFWSALLEKAYAKVHGSYEALKGGSTCEAMEDFTGGVTEMYEMNASPPNLFKIILKAYERGSLMGSSLEPDPNVLEAETPEGLIRGHAYSITRVKYVDIQTPNTVGKIPLLRLRNPWGNEIEWKGAWSDQSPEWRFIPDHEKENLGLTFDNDGEFWMSFKDFQNRFDRLEICNLTPDSLTEEEIAQGNKKQWEMSVFEGEWVRGITAGGCRNYIDTFWHNPQYRITLTDIDDDDDESKCTVIIALMQKNRRSKKQMGVEFLTIGFAVYYLPDPSRAPKPLDLNYFKYNASVARSPSFINLREVSCRFKLPPGTYCIVPSTFDPNDEGEFLLRVFSEHKNNMEEHDQIIPLSASNKKMQAPLVSFSPSSATVEEKEEVDRVYRYFLKLAGDDMEVDWEELKDVLDFATKTETKSNGFSKEVIRSIVALLDEDHSGRLGFREFKNLWGLIRKSKIVFHKHDKDNTGSLSGFELRQALNSVGYVLNNRILNILMHRYGNKQSEIAFEDFVLCGIKLNRMIVGYQKRNKTGGFSISVTFNDWIETTLYA